MRGYGGGNKEYKGLIKICVQTYLGHKQTDVENSFSTFCEQKKQTMCSKFFGQMKREMDQQTFGQTEMRNHYLDEVRN